MDWETEYWEGKLVDCYDEKCNLAIKISDFLIEAGYIIHHNELEEMLLLYKGVCTKYDDLIKKLAFG